MVPLSWEEKMKARTAPLSIHIAIPGTKFTRSRPYTCKKFCELALRDGFESWSDRQKAKFRELSLRDGYESWSDRCKAKFREFALREGFESWNEFCLFHNRAGDVAKGLGFASLKDAYTLDFEQELNMDDWDDEMKQVFERHAHKKFDTWGAFVATIFEEVLHLFRRCWCEPYPSDLDAIDACDRKNDWSDFYDRRPPVKFRFKWDITIATSFAFLHNPTPNPRSNTVDRLRYALELRCMIDNLFPGEWTVTELFNLLTRGVKMNGFLPLDVLAQAIKENKFYRHDCIEKGKMFFYGVDLAETTIPDGNFGLHRWKVDATLAYIYPAIIDELKHLLSVKHVKDVTVFFIETDEDCWFPLHPAVHRSIEVEPASTDDIQRAIFAYENKLEKVSERGRAVLPGYRAADAQMNESDEEDIEMEDEEIEIMQVERSFHGLT
jgi:hypothetical protein